MLWSWWSRQASDTGTERVATNCHDITDKKKEEKKVIHSIYEREELASYISIAKPFLRHHIPSSGGVQPADCPPAPAYCPPASEVPFR